MGKAKKWYPQESADLAAAWITASEEVGQPRLKGTGQSTEVFWASVMELFKRSAPEPALGTYHERGLGPIKTHWAEGIARDCKKFNKCLMKVYIAQPTGCTESNKLSMACAIHMGSSDTMNYRHKEFDPHAWRFYKAWCHLKDHRAFCPPSQQQATNVQTIDDGEDQDVAATDSGAGTGTSTEEDMPNSETPIQGRNLFNGTPASNTTNGNTTDPVASIGRHSRGGAGRASTKAIAAVDQHRKRKQEQLEEMLSIQKRNQHAFIGW